MKVEQVLKNENATPLEKARVFCLLGNPNIIGHSVARFYMNNVGELIDDFKLTTYKEAVLSDLRDFEGNKRNWQEKIKPMAKQCEDELIKEFIIGKMDKYNNLAQVKSNVLIEWAETLAAFLVGIDLRTNQIRKFLDGVRKVESNVKKLASEKPEDFTSKEIIFLKVHLAYATGRQKEVKSLMLVMNKAINKIREEGEEGFRDFEQFVKFVEAVIAYHKFYGGND